jgi:hypothetical protein
MTNVPSSSPASSEPFDFGKHRIAAVDQYQRIRPLYESFASVIHDILAEALRSRDIKVASIEARAKSLESFGNKQLHRPKRILSCRNILTRLAK